MVKSKKYKDGHTMEEMIDRVIYWWIRYKGTRTEDGKEFSKSDLDLLERRIAQLRLKPNSFKFSNPEMGVEY